MNKSELSQLSKDFFKEDPSAFRDALSDLIRVYGIADLASEVGFNRISLWRYMKGDQDIKLTTFIRILQRLGIGITFHSDGETGKMLRFLKWQKKMHASEEYKQFEKEMAEDGNA